MILTIDKHEKLLRSKSIPVRDPKDLKNIIRALELEFKKTSGVGLSAIQIGFNAQVAIIRLSGLNINLYNPKVLIVEEPFVFAGEGCLSIPGKIGATNRFNHIVVHNGNGKIIDIEGVKAVILQHEIDHFNGILFIDRLATQA